jgi:hypothetical protein
MKTEEPLSAHYVLCRPQGGLNDMLCQIEKCWQYAERFDRTLVIDTSFGVFKDDFTRYFSVVTPSIAPVLPVLSASVLDRLEALDVRPHQVRGRLGTYAKVYSSQQRCFVDDASGASLTFDFETDHPEACLLYNNSGGGAVAINCLKRLRLVPDIADDLRRLLEKLGDNYMAVHVRNTDYRTDYKRFFKSIEREVDDVDLLVCSDDATCVEFARGFFRRSRVFTVSQIPDYGGEPLHRVAMAPGERYRANVDALRDLLALAWAKKLFIANVRTPGTFDFLRFRRKHSRISGYSRLAQALNAERDVIRRLVNATA